MNINFSYIMKRKSFHHQFGSHEHGNECFVNCLYIVDVSRMWTIVSNSTTVYNIWKDLIKFITGPENGLSLLEFGIITREWVKLFYAKMNINFSYIMKRKSFHHQFGSHEHFPYGLTTHIFTCHYSIYISWRYKLPQLSQIIHMLHLLLRVLMATIRFLVSI
jgi:hypothetical protein